METTDRIQSEHDPLVRAEIAFADAENVSPGDVNAIALWIRAQAYAALAHARRQPIA